MQKIFDELWSRNPTGITRLNDEATAKTIFLDPRNRHSETRRPSDRDRIVTTGPSRFQPARPEVLRRDDVGAGYAPHPSCGDCPLTARSRPKISRKIVAGQ